MLKGTSWGVSKEPLLSIFRALIRPIIEYGMEVYFNSSDSSLKQVEKIQNECLRICAGALRSTPINCLQHYCNEMPLKIKFQQLCLYYRAYISTFSDHPSLSTIRDSWQERYPEQANFCSFNMRTKNFFEHSNLSLNKLTLPNLPIWLFKKPIINYDVFYNCRKHDHPNLIKNYYLSVINSVYYDFTFIFTDGCKINRGKFGFVCA